MTLAEGALMPDPPKHPVEQPAFRSMMLTSLFLGIVLLICAAEGGASSGFLSIVMVLMFAIFLISFGLYWLAWMLREHEIWREGRRGREE
ncbi:hypothetical protein ONA70_27890 [Micromonospora yasonensis]|uniref:hypothetical protein n=1 Tax=Micromonospora yasonensis TaxID=1128667 RepID=UPI00222E75C4|nr:hypothetical protein [Micromonospora yasonensis]MCW3843924.1 hypothetical protein [Micromonospora yasonensis]